MNGTSRIFGFIFALWLSASVTCLAEFGLVDVEAKAQALAAAPYAQTSHDEALPERLRTLSYDQYRAIRNVPGKALWQKEGLPFRLELLHSGYLFRRPVTMNRVASDGSSVTPLGFDPTLFDYEKLVLEEPIPFDQLTGYAGFRIQHPLNGGPMDFDEIGSFAGASYFRVLGKGQRYGISFRGLALNVAHHAGPEEFPEFVEYWLVDPEPGDRALQLYALLDSPSVTGAFSMKIVPGVATAVETQATLFFRSAVEAIGLAPLTSMHWYGENSRERVFSVRDWRPEVHDSDGLLFTTWNNETVWRPLYNGPQIRYTHFNAPDVKGFGLMQRDRDFSNYQDLSNPYHLTPSAWIEPAGKWGLGAVRLIELPTENEAIDNIVSFYQPEVQPAIGEPYHYEYTAYAMMEEEDALSPSRVIATRVGIDTGFPDTRRFVVDFAGPEINAMPADAPMFAEITSSANGFTEENQCFKNVMTDGWRIEFKLDTDDDNTAPVELRAFLKNPETNEILTETWSYLWHP